MNIRQVRPAWAEVDLDIFERNLQHIQKIVGPRTSVAAVVKANAYGHGLIECSKVAVEAKCRMLAVAVLDEALEIRRAGITAPTMVLGSTPIDQLDLAVQNDIDVTVYSADTAKALSRVAARLGRWAKMHVKIETGMGRLGLTPGAALERFLGEVAFLPNVSVAGVFTHFAASDADRDYTVSQFSSFRSALSQMARLHSRDLIRHTANSAGILDFPETHLDMVRPGIIIYGYYPSDTVRRLADFQPPLSLKARISHVRNAQEGETIGYGRTYRAERPMVVATLPLGYADGWFRSLSNKGFVLVRGKKAAIVGRVCMDQFMVDVTDIPGVNVGEEAVLIGRQGDLVITADDLANMVGTISHEILTRISARVPRVYKRGGSMYTIDQTGGQRVPLAD